MKTVLVPDYANLRRRNCFQGLEKFPREETLVRWAGPPCIESRTVVVAAMKDTTLGWHRDCCALAGAADLATRRVKPAVLVAAQTGRQSA